jgi:hypothetical protein
MRKAAAFFAFFISLPLFLIAQKHDNIWLMGLGGGNQSPLNDIWGATLFDFSDIDRPQVIEKQEYPVNFTATNASICDSAGNLLFYTNGEKVYGPNHEVMENGTGIAVTNADGYGYRLSQGAISLPSPGHENLYLLITVEANMYITMGWNLFSHTIDMTANNGLGTVIEKRNLLVQDSMAWGKISAVKHANGRDWWFVIPHDDSNTYCIGLVSSTGIVLKSQNIGYTTIDGVGESLFSSDGSKYVRVDNYNLLEPSIMMVMDFDRCSGELSNYQVAYLALSPNTFGLGASISPDSRYLYVNKITEAYQFDLWAADVFGTQTLVAQNDGFISNNSVNFFQANQLGPDGRVYIQGLNQGFHLHYINFPNRAGNACQFVQHGIETPTLVAREIPNFPNYRLGPIDGSACDTLGFDNHPLCNWRWEQEDTLSPLQVTFTDLSSYEPATWHWDFGDGTGSQDTSPVHIYTENGIYHVCLVVSNQYSSDTLCRVLQLGVSATHNAMLQSHIKVAPNPFQERLTISSPQMDSGVFRLYSQMGRILCEKRMIFEVTDIDTGALPPGMYFWEVTGKAGRAKAGKIIKTAR